MQGITGEYDYFICGSDQVWNPVLTKRINPVYFLDFVKDQQKKISYAPSVGVGRLTEIHKARMVNYMSSFARLSIREQEAIDLLQPYCEQDIAKTCDPVFLPKRECYERICSDKFSGRKFVFLYVVGMASKFRNVISYAEKKSMEKGLELYYLIDGDKSFMHIRGKNVFGCKPSDFLSLVKNAEYVISNSFHATAFSIIFERQFATLIKEGTGSRMLNLLRDFNLQDRVFDGTAQVDVFAKDIDYSHIEQTLQTYRKSSEDYLLNALKIKNDVRSTDKELVSARQQAFKDLNAFVESLKACYVARHLEAGVVAGSRSGGVFTALSDIVLSEGGVVYGCKMEEPGKAIHHRATTQEERDLFRGSKYIQSDMGDCYNQVREDLKKGIKVLFSGTACQIAGLLGFLQGEDTSRLFTVDIICHGVPSATVWNEYLKWMESKHNNKITEVNFRDKRYGWKAHLETVKMGDTTYTTSAFRVLFLKNAFLRPSCYECHFASIRRISDITIGDAWGIEKSSSRLNDNKGCSIVMVNTSKGKELFDNSKKNLYTENINLEDYLQPNLCQPSTRPGNRQQYWDYLSKNGFAALVRRYGKPGVFRRIKDAKLMLLNKFAKDQ